jgi:predicted DsbA family dithiol-disulfide isomerase
VGLETVIVFFDYLCPFAWRFAELAERVAGPLGIRFDFVHFSLYQSHHGSYDGWQVWNEPLDPLDPSGTKGLGPFLASLAARRQGCEAFDAFRLHLMRMRFEEHRPLDACSTVEAAERADLHLATFDRDLRDPELRTVLAKEHQRGVAARVCATPTIVFGGGHAAYVRLRSVPSGDQAAIDAFVSIRDMLHGMPYLETLERPRAPGN